MEERIFPLLPEGWHRELRWYTEEEFTNKTWQEGQIDPVQRHAGDIPRELDRDGYNPMAAASGTKATVEVTALPSEHTGSPVSLSTSVPVSV